MILRIIFYLLIAGIACEILVLMFRWHLRVPKIHRYLYATLLVLIFGMIVLDFSYGDKEQALVEAAYKGDNSKVQELINLGVSANSKACVEGCIESYPQTPLVWALVGPASEDKKALVVETLVKAGSDLNARDTEGNTILTLTRGNDRIQSIIKKTSKENKTSPK